MTPYHFVPAEHVLKAGMTLVRRSADNHTDAVVTVKAVEEGRARLCDDSCVPVRPDPSGAYKCPRLAYMSPTYRLPTPALL